MPQDVSPSKADRLTAPPAIAELVAKFDEHKEQYKRGDYNETQLRRDFLDPFFAAMGWDLDNRKGYSEKFREVIHEDALRVELSVRAPDYCFRVGGQRQFFVEAKKPAVNIREDAAPAFQLRRYAWTAKLPLSILTDFEELAVYDCRIKPDKNDKASVGRVMLLKYTEYVEKWHELASIFSFEAINRGAFDRYAESNKKKRGTAEVDEAFLEEIESWRYALARNISLRNKPLTEREVNTAVQLIIDRTIFLRMCEGRGIEPFGRLQALLNGDEVYRRLVELFKRADEKYNSGLFHFQQEKGRTDPDTLTTALVVDDKVLKDIVRRLYYPDSPYEFAALPADILGQVYEQFLGKVIRLTKSHQAKIEEKPEVRKAGGVYYTPTYIVDYIVENTVGKLLEGQTPQQVGGLTKTYQPAKTGRPLTVLDPACGSGSFLIVAYQYLLDWYLKQYTEEDQPEKHAQGKSPRIYHKKGAGWRLTTPERKRILLSHIYGVDIDYQACEVTKLSLLLKVLEGETEETLQRQLFEKERALPDLANNIKCGNSLIGPDFYRERQGELFDEEETLRINAFDWQEEFKQIFSGKNPGFDAVIGNPPYLFITEVPSDMRKYYQSRYQTVTYRFDLYGAFIEKALTEKLSVDGHFGFIIPHTLLSNDSFAKLRALLTTDSWLYRVVDFGPGVFKTAKNETMLLFFQNRKPQLKQRVSVLRATPRNWPGLESNFSVAQNRWAKSDGSPWLVHVDPEQNAYLEKLTKSPFVMKDFCISNQGVRTGNNEKYLSSTPKGPKWFRAAGGKQVSRYGIIPDSLYVYYDRSVLDAPRNQGIFLTPAKILVQEIRNISLQRRIVATLDEEQIYGLQSTNVVNLLDEAAIDIRFVLGLLNSNPVNVYFRWRFPGNNHVPSNQLLNIPFPAYSKELHDDLVTLVQRMLDLHKRLPQIKTSHERTAIERQIAATDREIDQLVYQLYGLTDKEIALVEEATAT